MNATAAAASAPTGFARAFGRLRIWLSAAFAAVLGLLPHVLHHAGPLAGAALLGGVAGSLLFGAAGLLLSIPFVLRVHRHCGNWRVPALLLVTFATVFSVSTFLVGPALTDTDDTPAPTIQAPDRDAKGGQGHEAHH